MTESQEYYAVIEIDSGRELYVGDSLSHAAHALRPGTVYGVGMMRLTARLRAWEQVRVQRQRTKEAAA